MKKKSLLPIFILIIPFFSFAQQFEWVHSNAINYALNPALPVNMVCASDAGPVYAAYLDSNTLVYGSDIYGRNKIDCYNSNGELQWSFYIGNKSVVNRTAADNDGDLFVGGTYMETMSINGSDSLTNTGIGFNVNVFLLCINMYGELVWKRNVTLTHSNYYGIAAMTVDAQNNFWYGAADFFSTEIYKVNGLGNEVMSYELQGAKTLGGFSFDSQGNLYASGATSTPSISVVNLTVTVPETYMMYVTRITASGQASWIQLIPDVTFQLPQVKADPWGSAYVSGSLLIGASFGNVSFLDPQWVYDVFLTRVDSNGNFQWGVQGPQNASGITGDFNRGTNAFLGVDENGLAYLTGTTRGTLDWGNGVTSGGNALPYDKISVLVFDTSGTVLWSKDGGTLNAGANLANSLMVNAQGQCYFSATITDEATFDTISVNANTVFASVFGKISAGVATSVSSVTDDHSLILYPNPVSDVLYFTSSLNGGRLKIFDSQGKCIRDFSSVKNSAVDVSGLSDGIYLMNYMKGNEMKSGRFAVIRK